MHTELQWLITPTGLTQQSHAWVDEDAGNYRGTAKHASSPAKSTGQMKPRLGACLGCSETTATAGRNARLRVRGTQSRADLTGGRRQTRRPLQRTGWKRRIRGVSGADQHCAVSAWHAMRAHHATAERTSCSTTWRVAGVERGVPPLPVQRKRVDGGAEAKFAIHPNSCVCNAHCVCAGA